MLRTICSLTLACFLLATMNNNIVYADKDFPWELFIPVILSSTDPFADEALTVADVAFFDSLESVPFNLSNIDFGEDNSIAQETLGVSDSTSITTKSAEKISIREQFLREIFYKANHFLLTKNLPAGIGSKQPAQTNGYAYMLGAKKISRTTIIHYGGTYCINVHEPYAIDCSGMVNRILTGGLNITEHDIDYHGATGITTDYLNRRFQTDYTDKLNYVSIGRNIHHNYLQTGDIVKFLRKNGSAYHIGIVLKDFNGRVSFIESHGTATRKGEAPCKDKDEIPCLEQECEKNMGPGRGPDNLRWPGQGKLATYEILRLIEVDPISISVNWHWDDIDWRNGGIIELTASGGYPPYKYSIDGGTTFSDSDRFEGLSKGNYYLAVSDINHNVKKQDVPLFIHASAVIAKQLSGNFWRLTANGETAYGFLDDEAWILTGETTVRACCFGQSDASYYYSIFPTYTNDDIYGVQGSSGFNGYIRQFTMQDLTGTTWIIDAQDNGDHYEYNKF